MQTADLFEVRRGDSIVPRVHRLDPHTSHQAAASAVEIAGRHQVSILVCLKLYGAKTGHEIAEQLGLDYIQVAKRLTELHEAGKVDRRQTGMFQGKPIYHTRASPSGRPACVWYLA